VGLIQRLRRPIFTFYLAWVAILLVRAAVAFSGSEWLSALPQDTFDFMVSMFATTFTAIFILGAVFAWFADAGHSWARWFFMGFCLFYAVDCLLGTLAVGPLYENMRRPYGFFRGPISFVVWGGLLWLACSKRPNHSVKRDAPQTARPLP
jgi:hypothetical protein